MVLPSAMAFFELGVSLLPPFSDGCFIPLGSAQRWLLQAPTQAPQYPSHLGRVVCDAPFPLDDLDHPPPGPDFPTEPESPRPPLQQLRQLGQLRVIQLGPPSRRLAAAQGFHSSLPRLANPLAHRPPGDPQSLGHVDLLPALLHQFPSPQPPGFLPYP